MALDLPVNQVLAEIGHDGSQIVWPALREPLCRRGFHPQELIDVCRAHGYAVTYLELLPCLYSAPGNPELQLFSESRAWDRFTRVIQRTRGVMDGYGVVHGNGHACAYGNGWVYDPDGVTYRFSRENCERRSFIAAHLWCLDRTGGAA
jgi:hypothetical protein